MNHTHPARHRLRATVLIAVASALIFGVTAWLGGRGAHDAARDLPASLALTPVATAVSSIPLYAYAGVDPALVPALLAPPEPGHQNLAALAAGLPPLGAYLPAGTEPVFALPTPVPTIAPSETPTPTRTPFAIPSPARTPTPGPSPTATGTPLPIIRKPTIMVPSPTPTYDLPTFTPQASGLDFPTLTPMFLGDRICAPAGWPATGKLTQYFHWYHPATDLGMPTGTPLVATHSGRVAFAGWRTDGYGNLVIIENGPYVTYYAHLWKFNVVEGQLVGRHSVIGWSGSTGNSTGPHLHYETHINGTPVDPLTFEQRGHETC